MNIRNLFCACAVVLALSAPASADTMIDLNTADAAQLKQLENVGCPPELIQNIIRKRTESGAFKSAEELRSVPGMTEELFNELYPFELNGSVVVEIELPPTFASY